MSEPNPRTALSAFFSRPAALPVGGLAGRVLALGGALAAVAIDGIAPHVGVAARAAESRIVEAPLPHSAGLGAGQARIRRCAHERSSTKRFAASIASERATPGAASSWRPQTGGGNVGLMARRL